MDDQLQELITLQREQNQLLKKYLWRLRLSLLSLLLITAATAIGLGVLVYQGQLRVNPTSTRPATAVRPPAGKLSVDTQSAAAEFAIDRQKQPNAYRMMQDNLRRQQSN